MKYYYDLIIHTKDTNHISNIVKIDHRKIRKDVRKFISCDDVNMISLCRICSNGKMLQDRLFILTKNDVNKLY